MDKTFDAPRETLVPLAVAPSTRELVRQLKRLTSARNIDIFLAPLLEAAIKDYGETPVTHAKAKAKTTTSRKRAR